MTRTLVLLGYLHWLAGNGYEQASGVIERFPHTRWRPLPYYLPAGPLTVAGAVALAVRGRSPADAAAACCALAAFGIGGFLVVTVNLPLLRGRTPRRPFRVWYRCNAARLALVTTAAALTAMHRRISPSDAKMLACARR